MKIKALTKPLCPHFQAENLLDPVMGLLKTVADTPNGASPKTVVILADYELDLLPFEAFSVFEGCASVSRDISLSLLSTRNSAPLDLQLNDFTYLVEPSISPGQGEQNFTKFQGAAQDLWKGP